jgi:ABC-type sugar transport system permease subunit
MYDETFLLTAGGPGNATELLSIYTAKAARGSNYGFSSAVSLVYLFIVIVLCFILYKTVMSIGEASK